MDTKGLAAAIFFGAVVTLIPFMSKIVLNVYQFQFPFFNLAARNILGILTVESLRVAGLLHVAPYSLKRATNKLLLLVSVCSAAQSLFTGVALKGMNIPMFGALRQTVPFVNLILMVVVLKKSLPPFLVTFSVLLITAGCLVAGFGDLSFDIIPYTAGLLSVVSNALHQTLVQRVTGQGFTVADTFQISSYNTFFMCLLGSVVTGEWQAIKHYPHLTDTDFLFAFTMFLLIGNLLNFSIDLCTSLNSALTTSLVMVLKNIPQTFIGYVTFGGVKYHPLNILGLGLNLVGAFLFTYGKYKESSTTRKKVE